MEKVLPKKAHNLPINASAFIVSRLKDFFKLEFFRHYVLYLQNMTSVVLKIFGNVGKRIKYVYEILESTVN
jgi:hypothetical protein